MSDQAIQIHGYTEQSFPQNFQYVQNITGIVTNTGARTGIESDPSNDNYHYFRGGDYDGGNGGQGLSILDRYKRFNNTEGNSITDEDSPESYPTQSNTLPTNEDINQDQNLSESESYFQYHVKLRPQDM